MLYIFWEFQVHPDKITEFERRYGTEGDWAMLFRSAAGYEKTVLGRDRNSAGHYLVTDVWDAKRPPMPLRRNSGTLTKRSTSNANR